MKAALLQLDTHSGDVEHNTNSIIQSVLAAARQGAELCVTPELALSGPPPSDMLLFPAFIDKVASSARSIAAHLAPTNVALALGLPTYQDGQLFNQAIFIQSGRILGKHSKRLLCLPSDKIYFTPGDAPHPIDWRGKRIALTIGDDWKLLPLESHDLIINLQARPFLPQECRSVENALQKLASDTGAGVLVANATGASDGIIYGGSSFAVDKGGHISARAREFGPEVLVVAPGSSDNSIELPIEPREAEIFQGLSYGLGEYFAQTGLKQALVGLSGGVDSALVAAIACEALGAENVRGVLLPSPWSSDHSVKDAQDLAANLGMRTDIVPIGGVMEACGDALKDIFAGTSEDVTEENLQARIRGLLLMAISNKFGAILLATGNRSELAVGYSTLYGDTCGALEVIGSIYKTEVYKVCRWLNATKGKIIPENILLKAPSAELRPGQKDEDSLPPYVLLDRLLADMLDLKKSRRELISAGYDPDTIQKVEKLVAGSQFKRLQSAPVLGDGLRFDMPAAGAAFFFGGKN